MKRKQKQKNKDMRKNKRKKVNGGERRKKIERS